MKASESTLQSLSNPFYRMIDRLMGANELVLFGRINDVSEAQSVAVVDLLNKRYVNEAVGYPFVAPTFDKEAATWSSKVLFHAAQLMMYREHEAESLTQLVPRYTRDKTASTILTADISLRFIPKILEKLEEINIEDELIPILKNLMKEWHYSGLLSDVDLEKPEFDDAFADPCLMQLYADRVISQRKLQIARLEKVNPLVKLALGNHIDYFWKEFNEDI